MPVIDNDPFGDIKNEKGNTSPEPAVVNKFHSRSDKDSALTAQHHTLGNSKNQASSGAHIHDGKTSRLLGDGQALTITGKLSPTTVAEVDAVLDSVITLLANFVSFTDART